MYQATVALPPVAPRVHFDQDQLVSNPFALNTEIIQPQEKLIFSHDGRFYTSNNVFDENGHFAKLTEIIHGNKVDCMIIFPNNGIFVKLEDKRDNIDHRMFMDDISDFNDLYKFVTYNKDEGLEIDTDDQEYQTPRLHQSNFLNYRSSVIKDKSDANGHYKESNDAPNNSYLYNLKDFDMLKAVADERAHVGLTNKKELDEFPAQKC